GRLRTPGRARPRLLARRVGLGRGRRRAARARPARRRPHPARPRAGAGRRAAGRGDPGRPGGRRRRRAV
ncbi:MAG: putative esterase, partial [uncultured Quadrisphaera sp.]